MLIKCSALSVQEIRPKCSDKSWISINPFRLQAAPRRQPKVNPLSEVSPFSTHPTPTLFPPQHPAPNCVMAESRECVINIPYPTPAILSCPLCHLAFKQTLNICIWQNT